MRVRSHGWGAVLSVEPFFTDARRPALAPADTKELEPLFASCTLGVGILQVYSLVTLDVYKEVSVLELVMIGALDQVHIHGAAVKRPVDIEVHLKMLVALGISFQR